MQELIFHFHKIAKYHCPHTTLFLSLSLSFSPPFFLSFSLSNTNTYKHMILIISTPFLPFQGTFILFFYLSYH